MRNRTMLFFPAAALVLCLSAPAHAQASSAELRSKEYSFAGDDVSDSPLALSGAGPSREAARRADGADDALFFLSMFEGLGLEDQSETDIEKAAADSSATRAGDDDLEQDGDETGALARAVQNPVADLISLPFQNNILFNVGRRKRVANVLNVQPVIPITLNEDWNLITRTIVPILYRPAFFNEGDEFGLGDIQFTAFLSPAAPSKTIWGVGPVFRFPSSTDDSLGSEKWSAGLSGVVLRMDGPWVYGALVQQLWSFAGESGRDAVNEFLLQPFVNYNMDDGWYLTSSPIITANWKSDNHSDVWTIPVGGGAGRVFRIGKQAVNMQFQGFYNVATPRFGPDWSLRVQFQLLFPKGKGK